jgi:hypothetical protein
MFSAPVNCCCAVLRVTLVSEVLTSVTVKLSAFCHVTPCSRIEVRLNFKGMRCPSLQDKTFVSDCAVSHPGIKLTVGDGGGKAECILELG